MWLPLLGVVVGSVLTYLVQARRDAVAHERAMKLRDADRADAEADRQARGRARMGRRLQELVVRVEDAHVGQRVLHWELKLVAQGRPPQRWGERELLRVEAESRREFARISAEAIPFGPELYAAARDLEAAAVNPPSVDPENVKIIEAVARFKDAAAKWLGENTDGPGTLMAYD